MGGCSQLRESFRRFAQSPSAANGCPAKTLNFGMVVCQMKIFKQFSIAFQN
ncbi:TMV resistance protein N [Sesbania bispinosa]|nr:TMV resistance protein N [Sesbania bispinosa]